MVAILKRGAVSAPVDPASPYVDTHQVFSDAAGVVWDAMLNQTDLHKNANKFYILQLLHPIGNTGKCHLYTRWGRVGEKGSSQIKGPWPPYTAIREFKKQFRVKTQINWERREGIVKKGKYTWLERASEDEAKRTERSNVERSVRKKKGVPNSALAPELQALCKHIFSISYINAALSSMDYDANRLPLGKLAKTTVLSGFEALKTLAEVLEKPGGDLVKQHGGFQQACAHYSSVYYSIIPHAFGRNRPTIIDDLIRLTKELELVDALGNMEIAQKLISSSILADEHGNPVNPMDAYFRSLGLSSMEPVYLQSQEFMALEAYVHNTHGATHHFTVKVQNAFRVERSSETEAWQRAGFDSLGNGERLLLWHGSRSTNFAGILKQGLRIAPPEAPVSGYMFGKGVYFADMMSKSATYCHASHSDSVGILLLCEVAAQPVYELYKANSKAAQECQANNTRATKGVGRIQPVRWQDAGIALNNFSLVGCQMPDGPGEDVSPNASLKYNEYIVYDTAQIRLRYLLMVEMDGAS